MTNSEHIPNGQVSELLPCPFCGFAIEPTRSGLSGNHDEDCFMRQIALDTTNPKAVAAWSRRALTRRSSAGVKVKALEWEKSNVADRWTAQYPFGQFEITHYNLDYIWQRGICSERFDTLEAAMAACQADFNTRILSALSSPSHIGIGEDDRVIAEFGAKLAAAQTDTDPDFAAALAGNRTSLYLHPSPSVPPQGETISIGHMIAIVRPEGLEQKDWKGWDIAVQAMIVAYREAVREKRSAALASKTQGEGDEPGQSASEGTTP